MDIRNFILRKRSGTDLSDEPDISSGKEVSGRTESVTVMLLMNCLPRNTLLQKRVRKHVPLGDMWAS